MDVALISEYFPRSGMREMRGGVEARTYFVGRGLAKEHDVTVYSIKEDGLEDSCEIEGMKVVRVSPQVKYSQSESLGKRLLFMKNSAREIKRQNHDLVDGCSVLGYPSAWFSGCENRVITYHDLWVGRWVRNLGFKGLFGEALERYVLSRSWDHIISVSQYTKRNLIEYGLDEKHVTVARNAIDVKEYSRIRSSKYENPTVCAIARLVKYKRLDDLVKAVAKVRGEIPEVQAKVVGTGPELERLKRLSSSLGVDDCIEFLGYVERHEDVLKILKSSHVFCLPSVVEGFGITVLEAMALKVPYVAAGVDAVMEASNGEGGVFYRPCDTGELASRLIDALSGNVEAGAGDIWNYDWSKTVDIVKRVYESLM